MKHIAYSLAAFALAALGTTAMAAPFDFGNSILTGTADASTGPASSASATDRIAPAAKPMRGHPVSAPVVAAPKLDGTAPAVEVAPPIPAGTVVYPESTVVQQHHHSMHHHHHPPKKQNMFDKLMELERKKNAWLKRTFLGR